MMIITSCYRRYYYVNNPTLTLSHSGLVGGDSEADLDMLPAASTTGELTD